MSWFGQSPFHSRNNQIGIYCFSVLHQSLPKLRWHKRKQNAVRMSSEKFEKENKKGQRILLKRFPVEDRWRISSNPIQTAVGKKICQGTAAKAQLGSWVMFISYLWLLLINKWKSTEWACHTSVVYHEFEQEFGHSVHQLLQSLPQRFVQLFFTNQKVQNLAKLFFDVDMVVFFFELKLTNFCGCLLYFIFLQGSIDQQSVQELFEILQVPFWILISAAQKLPVDLFCFFIDDVLDFWVFAISAVFFWERFQSWFIKNDLILFYPIIFDEWDAILEGIAIIDNWLDLDMTKFTTVGKNSASPDPSILTKTTSPYLYLPDILQLIIRAKI